MEPPSTAPRVAEPASLTRLWRKTDVADHVVSFLPTKCLAVLPTLADSFRRDQWRMLGVVMRRQGGRAAGTRAILSTLQVMGRELSHYSEDWQGEASLIRQRWRGCRGGRGVRPNRRRGGRRSQSCRPLVQQNESGPGHPSDDAT